MSVWSRIRSAANRWSSRKSFGAEGERVARRFLRRRCRLTMIAKGYTNHIGEIDLIAVDRRSRPFTIVFVEVKTRRDDGCGTPVEAVDARKQRQITRTALVYLKENDLLECRVRFDVVGIIWPSDARRPEIQYFPDAFCPPDRWQMFF